MSSTSLDPYASSSVYTRLESQVLSEYSRLSQNIDQLSTLAADLSSLHPAVLELVRPLESKLGLVLTLFKASVWAHLVSKEATNQMEEASRREQELERERDPGL